MSFVALLLTLACIAGCYADPPSCDVLKLRAQADLSYCLASLPDGSVVMVYCQDNDPLQEWVFSNNYDTTDGFLIRNLCTERALRHGTSSGDVVTSVSRKARSPDLLWTMTDVLNSYFYTIRSYDNAQLNLDVDHGDRRGIRDNNRLIIYPWHKSGNQLWQLEQVYTVNCLDF